MILRRSDFVHVVPLDAGHVLVLHALTHLRLGVDGEIGRLLAWFDRPRDLPAAFPELMAEIGYDAQTLAGCVASLVERGVLTDKTPDAELAETRRQLAETDGRDPGEALERFRRRRREGSEPYWSVAAPRGAADLDGRGRRLDLLLLGDCQLQMEADFLRRAGAARGLDLRIATTFPDDVRFAGERRHDAILIGALRLRGTIVGAAASAPPAATHDEADTAEDGPFGLYLAEARQVLAGLRRESAAPILIDALPEPTVQPLGFAERGPAGHRNLFRRANLALAGLAERFADVHVVDVAAVLAAAGSTGLLDDGLTSFTHFGSPGWMLQRPAAEKAAVHDLFPDPAPLVESLGGDPYRRESVMAEAHVDALVAILGIDAKKCVVVDLDGVLWPGVLAETGSPFAWHPEISSQNSYVGLFFGIHEALKVLKRRGIVLAAVSKNDETTLRDLWHYPEHYPRDRLLTPDDFVTWRVDWNDKVDNIGSIAEELGFALETFVFVDDHPIERERVRRRLPEVLVWGEDLFGLRRLLLADPRLQPVHIGREAADRTTLVKAQLDRARLRAAATSEREVLASLDIVCDIARAGPDADLERVREVFGRTTQFNTTGRKFTLAELRAIVGAIDDLGGTGADLGRTRTELGGAGADGAIFTMKVRDRFGDHGLVAAAVVSGGEILGLAMSCRVMGLGVEHQFLAAILAALSAETGEAEGSLTGRIVSTARNLPVRHVYRDAGFEPCGDGLWRFVFDGRTRFAGGENETGAAA